MSTAFPITTAAPVLVVALMAAMAAKHFLCDFLLQTSWMARGKERPSGWATPLLAHAAVHAGFLILVALAFRPAFWWLGVIDFVVHAAIDRGKATVSRATAYPTSDERFWWLLGFDQFLHQLTNVAFTGLMLMAA